MSNGVNQRSARRASNHPAGLPGGSKFFAWGCAGSAIRKVALAFRGDAELKSL